jgi:hypothetical protein
MIPETVNICGIQHKIKLCDDNFNTDLHFGQIDYAKCEIRVNKDMPEAMQKQTLCHEMLHGMLILLGYNEQGQDEQFVQALSMAINQSFKLKEADDG